MDMRVALRDIAGLVFWLALCLGVASAGSAITALSVHTWYQELSKPSFNPPDWVFAPVWISLFVLMAVAAWLVWQRTGFAGFRGPLFVFGVQLALNLAWSVLFFGLRAPGWALLDIVILWGFILATVAVFHRVSRVAALFLVPYLLWVSFAVVLNASIWWLS